MFSMHVNIPVGSQSVTGWAVVIEFDYYVNQITQVGDLNYNWLDGGSHRQIKIFKPGRLISGTPWNLNVQGSLGNQNVGLTPIVHWCPTGRTTPIGVEGRV